MAVQEGWTFFKEILKDKPAVRKTDVPEQRAVSFDWNSEKQGEFKAFGRRGRQLKRTTGMM